MSNMSSVDSVFLIITAVCLSLFFLIGIIFMIYTWVVFHTLVKKAEQAINSVETATTIIKEAGNSGILTSFLKAVKLIFKLSRKM